MSPSTSNVVVGLLLLIPTFWDLAILINVTKNMMNIFSWFYFKRLSVTEETKPFPDESVASFLMVKDSEELADIAAKA